MMVGMGPGGKISILLFLFYLFRLFYMIPINRFVPFFLCIAPQLQVL